MTSRGSRLAAVLFADIVSYSELAARDETLALKLIEVFESSAHSSIPRYGGRVVKFLGDGVLAEFSSSRAAIGAAAAFREEFVRRAEESGLGEPALRAGIHVGDVTVSGGDILGDGVNAAARLQESAGPGEILVSGPVHLQLRQRREIAFETRGEQELKGVGRLDAYAVTLAEPIEPEPTPQGHGEDGRSLPRWGKRTLLALVAVAAIGLGWYRFGGVDAKAANRSIAVLPFEVVGEEFDSTFIEGIHGEVQTRLSSLSTLIVISRSSVRGYLESDRPISEMAEQLGVHWILQGDVQQIGDRVQVNARLVDARDGRQVWAEGYRRELSAENLFEIQGEITGEIVQALQVELTPEEERRSGRVPTESTAAYELYLQARVIDHDQHGAEATDRKIGLYRRTLELDPGFAEAWAGLADAYVERVSSGRATSWADSAVAASRRALELDPGLADAWTQIGDAARVQDRIEEAISAYGKALELEPSNSEAVWNLGEMLRRSGRLAEAMKWMERGHRLDPLHPEYLAQLEWLNNLLGRDEVGDAWLDRLRKLESSRSALGGRWEVGELVGIIELHVALFYRNDIRRAREILRSNQMEGLDVVRDRAALALYAGKWEEARELYQRLYAGTVRERTNESWHQGYLWDPLGLAYAMIRMEDVEQGREIAREVTRATASTIERVGARRVLMERMAVARLLAGDEDAALMWLERAFEDGFQNVRVLRTLPVLDPLRDDPRFQALLDRKQEELAEELRKVEAEGWGLPDD